MNRYLALCLLAGACGGTATSTSPDAATLPSGDLSTLSDLLHAGDAAIVDNGDLATMAMTMLTIDGQPTTITSTSYSTNTWTAEFTGGFSQGGELDVSAYRLGTGCEQGGPGSTQTIIVEQKISASVSTGWEVSPSSDMTSCGLDVTGLSVASNGNLQATFSGMLVSVSDNTQSKAFVGTFDIPSS